MTEDEAVNFLIMRTNIDDAENAKKIAKRLGCLPLALEQAAAFIYEQKESFDGYLELIRKYDLRLLSSNDGVDNYGRNIHTVWNITLERLSENAKTLTPIGQDQSVKIFHGLANNFNFKEHSKAKQNLNGTQNDEKRTRKPLHMFDKTPIGRKRKTP